MITTILSILGGLASIISKVLDFVKESRLVRWGREQFAADLARDEIEINRKQTEILNQDRTKEDVVKRMNDGTF